MLNRVRELRIDRKLTQDELAKLLGVSQETVSRIEGGLRSLDAKLIERLSKAFKVEPWELFIAPAAALAAPDTSQSEEVERYDGTSRA